MFGLFTHYKNPSVKEEFHLFTGRFLARSSFYGNWDIIQEVSGPDQEIGMNTLKKCYVCTLQLMELLKETG